MKTLLGLFAVLSAIALAVLGSAVFAALAVSTASSWILSGSFSDAWNMSWGRFPVLVLWFFMFCVLPRMITFRKKGRA